MKRKKRKTYFFVCSLVFSNSALKIAKFPLPFSNGSPLFPPLLKKILSLKLKTLWKPAIKLSPLSLPVRLACQAMPSKNYLSLSSPKTHLSAPTSNLSSSRLSENRQGKLSPLAILLSATKQQPKKPSSKKISAAPSLMEKPPGTPSKYLLSKTRKEAPLSLIHGKIPLSPSRPSLTACSSFWKAPYLWPADPPAKIPSNRKYTLLLTARISPCHVSNSHSLLNSTICFYDHQPQGDTWPYGTATLGKNGCRKWHPNGGLHLGIKNNRY